MEKMKYLQIKITEEEWKLLKEEAAERGKKFSFYVAEKVTRKPPRRAGKCS